MAWTTVSAGAGAADPAVRAQSRWRERTGATATGLSPRKVRLATGSLRRSFFTLGRLLALTSWQLSMVRPAPTEQALGSAAAAPEGSELSPPREKSRRLGEAAARTPDTHWVDPPLRPGSGSALPAEGGAGQGSARRRRGRWSPPRVPAPTRNGSAADAGRTARLRSWEASPARLLAGARTVPATRPASAPGPRAHQGRLRFRCSPARSAQGQLGAKAGGGGNPASETRVCPRETASSASARGGEGRAAERALRPEPLAPTPLASAHLPPRPPSVPRRPERLQRSNSREGPLSLLQSSPGSLVSGGGGLHPARSVPCHIPSSNL